MRFPAGQAKSGGIPLGSLAVRAYKEDGSNDVMNFVDLIKATLVCGGLAFLIYSFPVISQALIIGVLAVLWLGYARKVITSHWRRC